MWCNISAHGGHLQKETQFPVGVIYSVYVLILCLLEIHVI
jgi:hypothetical protein